MSSLMTILKQSAITEGVKSAKISSEIMRRLKISPMGLSSSQIEEFLSEYMRELEAMGYDLNFRTHTLKAVMVWHMRVLYKVTSGNTR